MPALNLKDIRKDLHFPELRLPEMSRDDIAKALGEARKEMADVRRDLNEFRREIELPKVDVSRADVENVADDVARTAREAANDARKVSKEAAKVLGKNVEKGRKEALKAAQKAGIVKKPSRIPYVLGGFITLGLVGWALSNPASRIGCARWPSRPVSASTRCAAVASTTRSRMRSMPPSRPGSPRRRSRTR